MSFFTRPVDKRTFNAVLSKGFMSTAGCKEFVSLVYYGGIPECAGGFDQSGEYIGAGRQQDERPAGDGDLYGKRG